MTNVFACACDRFSLVVGLGFVVERSRVQRSQHRVEFKGTCASH
jgi:hypothetical protein